MRILTTALMAALTFAGFAQAAPSAKDRAAIASMETRLTLLEGSRPGSKTKSLAARMAELNVPGRRQGEVGTSLWLRGRVGAPAGDSGHAVSGSIDEQGRCGSWRARPG